MIGIGIRIGVVKTSNPVLVVVATSATGVGETSFTANWNPYSGAQYYLLDVSTSSSFSSFVLQNQVVTTNSYIVTGLTASTTYYYRVRASTDPDPDAQAFFDRVATAGGTLSTTEKNAVNKLVLDMKSANIWTAMKAIYPMVGASAAACAQNLKSSSFTGSFSSGWTFSSTGATPNGTSAYMNTNFIPNNNLTLNSGHLSVYSRTNNTTGIDDIGVTQNGDLRNMRLIINDGGTLYCDINTGYTSRIAVANANSLGFYVGTRTSSTSFKVFKNNTTLGTNSNVNSGTQPTINIYVGADNLGGIASNFSNRQNAFASIGDGLTDTQASNFYTAVQTFQTTLGRQV